MSRPYNEEKIYHVYEWYDVDTGYIFYVGMGIKNRWKVASKGKRNKKFLEYKASHRCKSRKIADNVNEMEGCSIEDRRIKELKAIGMCSCNIISSTNRCGYTFGKDNAMYGVSPRERMDAETYRLWKEHHIPFLVIEPAKNEYRAMIDSIPDIQVFTPGKDFISPYIINPFIPPKNVKLQSYKTVLKTAFSAGVSMGTPLDKIFEDTLDECYSRAGWLPHYTIDDGGEIFTMDDFLKTFMEVFEKIGYRGDAANIGKAGYVRFKSLLRIFGNYNTIPVEDLLSRPTIIELAAIENEDQKSLLIALLLLNIQSYVNSNFIGTGELKNVLLLEEAHVLLAAGDSKGEGEANPSAVAKKLLTRMLAEIRSLGVGIVIADQSPEKVTSDVVKLTNIKLSFNLVEKNDRTILGDSTDMKPIQVERLAKLRPGEAFFYMNGLEEPEEIITEDYRKRVNIRTTISDNEIAEKSTYWNDKKDKLKPFLQCKCAKCCNSGCDYKLKAEAEEYSRRIYISNFNEQSKDRAKLVEVYKEIPKIIKGYIGENANTKMECCTKIHFLRRIIYNTKIPFSKVAAEKTINAEFNK